MAEAKGVRAAAGVGCPREMSKDFKGKEGMMRETVSFMGKNHVLDDTTQHRPRTIQNRT